MRVIQFPLLPKIKEGKGKQIKQKIEKKDFKSHLKSAINNPKEIKFFFFCSNFSINQILANKGKPNLRKVFCDIKKEGCVENSQKKTQPLKQKEKLMNLHRKSDKKLPDDFSELTLISLLSTEKKLDRESIPKVTSIKKNGEEKKIKLKAESGEKDTSGVK
ncbi:hypothetical protein J7K55_09330, partial [Candidatus Aerophobetes bacterium]|nr:hypothetical protein [Candidatus Aerophobetes bacterium]